MSIKNNLLYNSNKNYCDQLKKKKSQKKQLKSGLPLGIFNINKYLLYLYIIYLIGYSGRGSVGYTQTRPHPRIRKSPNSITHMYN